MVRNSDLASLVVFVKIRLPLASSISLQMYHYLSAETETCWVRSHGSPGFAAEASRRQNEKPVVQKGRALCGGQVPQL